MAYLEEEDSLQANTKNNVGEPSVGSLVAESGQTHRSAPTEKKLTNVGVNLCVHPGCNTVKAIDYTTRYPTVYGKKL
jgi:coproporphyrinogen III oxidase